MDDRPSLGTNIHGNRDAGHDPWTAFETADPPATRLRSIGANPKLGLDSDLRGLGSGSHRLFQLRSKLGTILMPVHLDGMMSGSLDKFIFTVGRDGNCALRFAWKFPAIDRFCGP